MSTQTATTEERLSRLEGAFEQLNERLGDIRSEMAAMNTRINVTMVLIGGVWVTLAAGLIAIFTQT